MVLDHEKREVKIHQVAMYIKYVLDLNVISLSCAVRSHYYIPEILGCI